MDPISVSSGLVALVTFAFQSGNLLYNTIESYQNHPKKVRDLRDELKALKEVLAALQKTVDNDTTADFSALKLPLLQCGNACVEFELLFAKCTSHSDGSRTSIRDWIKVAWKGSSIDDFKTMIAAYKATIAIALAHANLSKTSVTPANIEDYKDMIDDATDELKKHQKRVEDMLAQLSTQSAVHSAGAAAERRSLEEERLSTQQCLAICAELSTHIEQLEPTIPPLAQGFGAPPPIAPRATTSAIRECKVSLGFATTHMQDRLKDIDNQLEAMPISALSLSERDAEVAKLQEQKKSFSQCIDICNNASEEAAKERTNVIQDVTVDSDSCQLIVSSTGQLIWVKGVSSGPRSLQMIGQAADTVIQQISSDHHGRLTPQFVVDQKSGLSPSTGFRDRYGPGFKLSETPVHGNELQKVYSSVSRSPTL